jgi:hypothetical protein
MRSGAELAIAPNVGVLAGKNTELEICMRLKGKIGTLFGGA